MVFSSIPTYLDPSNWQQQPQHQQQLVQQNQSALHHGVSSINPDNSNPLLLPPPPPTVGPNGWTGPITRPISMAELPWRISNTPKLAAAVKCPRCESTNTKFCYYNNRSLSQPRHWCRNCHRHWTRGGALRTVPVGGARRKNKSSKSSSSSSAAASSAATPPPVLGVNNGSVGVEELTIPAPPEMPEFPFGLEAELSSFEIGHVIGLTGWRI